MISLSEPFLGASIIPVLTDTGTTASAITRQSAAADQTNAAGTTNVYLATLTIGAPGTTTLEINLDHDCHTDAISSDIVYRRSDDPSNQNLYRTTGDTGVATQTLHLTRGSSDVYAVGAADSEVVSGGYVQSTSVFTFGGNPDTVTAAADEIFINGHGPLTVTDVTAAAVTVSAASDAANIFTNAAGDTQTDLTQTNGAYPAYKTATMTGVAAGNILTQTNGAYP